MKMYSTKKIVIIVGILASSLIGACALIPAKQNFIQQKFNLYNDVKDADKYQVEYEVDFTAKSITFEVTVETTGFVGFGLSPGKGMNGADIIIGGVHPNNSRYFSDRHGVGNNEPILDDDENWELLNASENGTHTYLQFSRPLNTCDKKHDVPITEDTLSIIWSYGETDSISHHGANKGSYDINLLDPTPEVDVSKFDTWDIVRNMTMPTRKTSYWCTIHKAPQFTEKIHVVGFNTKLESPEALRHTHHFILYQCHAPEGEDIDEIFGPLTDHPGAECYEDPHIVRKDLCTSLLNIWAVGGKPMLLPEYAGYTLVESNEPVYVMYEVHYDNPGGLEGVQFESTLQVLITNQTRQYEAAMLALDHTVTYSLVIPGNTEDFVNVGHCGSECTKAKMNKDGFKIFNVMHHAHVAGRKLKVRQFRDGKELPWVSSDDNYAFDYQQNRPLREERLILPGDHLTVECTYSTSGKRDVTLGGPSTNEEMCQAMMWYYPKDELRYCESAYPEWEFEKLFGIEGISWDNIMEPPTVLGPESMANKSLPDVLTNQFSWSADKVAELQRNVRYADHYQVTCGSNPMSHSFRRTLANKAGHKLQQDNYEYLTYPKVNDEYAPADACKLQAGGSSTTETGGGGGATKVSFITLGFTISFFAAISTMGLKI